MGFIAQTFGNTFWASNDNHQASPTARARKVRPKSKSSKDSRSGIQVPASTDLPLLAEGTGANKKRRHASPDAGFRPQHAVSSSDPGRPSYSASVASDEPLIMPPSKAKGKSPSNQPGLSYEPNPNQTAYTNAAWVRSPPRLQARPPTTNSLDTRERSELVRRSRKLGSILGETPRLLDANEDDSGALDRLEGRQAVRSSSKPRTPSSAGRPNYRRSLTLDTISVGYSPSSASRHSFLLNDENASTPRDSYRNSGPGPRFGRSRSNARRPPVLRLSATPTSENPHPYFGRRHSSDLSVRRGPSLNSMDMNVIESGSDVSAPKAPSFDTSSLGSSTMPTFARPRSPSSFLDNVSLSSKISLSDSLVNFGVGVPGCSTTIEQSLPPSPTTPLTPLMTQAEDARRKMRKLARHLGETVPADLVLGTAGAKRAAHDHLTEEAAPQFLQVPAKGVSFAKSKSTPIAQSPFSLGKPPLGHRKAQSVWKGADQETPLPSRLMVRRASSAEQLRIETPTKPQMTADEKARNVRRAMKMLQLFGAPPPHELYTNAKSCSLDLPASSTRSPRTDNRASVNSFRDLAFILDHDNRNSLLALIGDTMADDTEDPAVSPFADAFETKANPQSKEEEPFQARRARANRLAKFFGVSYRDLFDAVCAEDTTHFTNDKAASGPSSHPALQYLPEPAHGSEVMTNNGSKWVEPKSVDEVLDRLRAMKATR